MVHKALVDELRPWLEGQPLVGDARGGIELSTLEVSRASRKGFGWLGAAPAAAENITKREMKTAVRKRLRLPILGVPPARDELSIVCLLFLRPFDIVSDNAWIVQDHIEAKSIQN